MSDIQTVSIAVEGELDEVVLKKILHSLKIEVARTYGNKGKPFIKKHISAYNKASRYGRWVVLVDLNNEAECPPLLVGLWIPTKDPNLQLRVAVREIEAWLLADRREISHFLGVSEQRIPVKPETESDPKKVLINIARYSRNMSIRRDITPQERSTASQGPGYTSRMIEFVINHWSPQRAGAGAPSLKRSLNSLLNWVRTC